MPARAALRLVPGHVYRTRDFACLGANPTRTARRLVREGRLRAMRHGLFTVPRTSTWGPLPTEDQALLTAFLGTEEFVSTGSEYWNTLGLGSTAIAPEKLVYNAKRSGLFELDARRFRLRRVAHPRRPTPEWYVVDLLENHALSGTSLSVLGEGLVRALRRHDFDPTALHQVAERFGTRRTLDIVERAIAEAGLKV